MGGYGVAVGELRRLGVDAERGSGMSGVDAERGDGCGRASMEVAEELCVSEEEAEELVAQVPTALPSTPVDLPSTRVGLPSTQ